MVRSNLTINGVIAGAVDNQRGNRLRCIFNWGCLVSGFVEKRLVVGTGEARRVGPEPQDHMETISLEGQCAARASTDGASAK